MRRSDPSGQPVRRHSLVTRIWHWVNAVVLPIMLMSGLMIFNAHPRLYWGNYGANFDPSWFEIDATSGGEGMMRIGSLRIVTTGLLGVWTDGDGQVRQTAFPGWATIPSQYSLADARLWHMAFAWVLAGGLLIFLLWSLVSGHVRRDLHITRHEWRWRSIRHDLGQHVRLRFPAGAAAMRYGVLQKLAYGFVLFIALPLMILTGLAMAPGAEAAGHWLSGMFGGRQTARSLHFIAAFALAAFFAVHIVMVLLSGPVNQLRAMVTGWYRLPREREGER